MTDPLAALAAAVEVLPDDVGLRLRYAELLVEAGRPTDAIEQAAVVLRTDPAHAAAQAVVRRAAASATDGGAVGSVPPGGTDEVGGSTAETGSGPVRDPSGSGSVSDQTGSAQDGVDWHALERELADDTPPPFVAEEGTRTVDAADQVVPASEIHRETTTLADVGGLDAVKRRIDESFLQPMAHPEVARAFGKTLRGGLLLYGPPGCGKTFIARAIAGELGAHFLTVSLSDVLDRFLGESEKNIHRVFEQARAAAPAVLFFDEMDAIGGKRSAGQWSSFRTVVNQLLVEMDGIDAQNDGLYVLAATNHPWDVDAALKRPGRFDRMVFVGPPDDEAREAVLRVHLRKRPIEGIDLGALVRRTRGFSGADLQHLVTTAAEKAMADSIRAGAVRPIRMPDLRDALREVKPSIGAWTQAARNVAEFANTSGEYDELAEWLRTEKPRA
ncbi:ATP-binding protein [Curtobacterium sp. MCSS17_008]|uniref:ATP-binding protein n=1 Tax=Curtobacterium sp. MCSS17_008 TaxID=2175647 RepID=UPI000DA9151E|nr:ATP-binding protein [Curtobacterium sp. MCSS17_008]PZF59696.1 ATP-binding protein [Curtobacterium sp. MCSS17_008]